LPEIGKSKQEMYNVSSTRKLSLLKPRAGIQITPGEVAALKVAESNHRRNTTLPKTNQLNYRSEAVSQIKRDVTTIDKQMIGNDDKIVEINDYLKSKIDVSKLNIRMFQSKIQRF
jgi:hypothetical protein